jgi:glycerol kinase
MSRTLLAIDAGTTGVTTILFDEQLETLARSSREFEQLFPEPGQVEHSAEAILEALDATLTEVLAGVQVAPAAVGIANQRETVFALDLESGRALGTGIVWQDRRTAGRCAELKAAGHEDMYRSRTGLVLDPYFSGTKIEWLLSQRDAVAAGARAGRVRFCTVDALIVHHLTGGKQCATDPTNASRTLLYDIDARQWSAGLGAPLGIDPDWLPTVLSSTANFGEAQLPGGLRAPIHGIAGDQQAALFGQGCVAEGSFKNTYGTGCFLLLNTGERRVDSTSGLLTTLAVGSSGEPCYALEGSVFSGGLIVQWLRDGLGILDHAAESEALAREVPDSAGVFLVPAFAGLGAPYWDPDARAALLGLTRGTRRPHIARAALEAIALQCAEIVELLRADTGLAIDELLVDGGAAANDLLLSLQADAAGLTVVRPPQVEATARGAAALAGMGVGLWPDPGAVLTTVGESDQFSPQLAGADRDEWLAGWKAAVARVRS